MLNSHSLMEAKVATVYKSRASDFENDVENMNLTVVFEL